jgi:hypothetical protein
MYVYYDWCEECHPKGRNDGAAVEKSKKPEVVGAGSDASDSSVRRYQKSRE